MDSSLNNFLERMLRDADGILSYPSLMDFFESRNCKRVFKHQAVIPPEFNPEGNKTNFKFEYGFKNNPEKTFLFLGKVNKSKGVELLLETFSKLDDAYLIIIGNGKSSEKCQNITERSDKKNKILFLDAVPPWKVPNMIRSVKAVVIPEHNFGVELHRSRIPIESLLCGTIPIVSTEISRFYGDLSNYFVTFNPESRSDFKNALELVLKDHDRSDKIINDKEKISTITGSFEGYVSNIESILMEIAN